MRDHIHIIYFSTELRTTMACRRSHALHTCISSEIRFSRRYSNGLGYYIVAASLSPCATNLARRSDALGVIRKNIPVFVPYFAGYRLLDGRSSGLYVLPDKRTVLVTYAFSMPPLLSSELPIYSKTRSRAHYNISS